MITYSQAYQTVFSYSPDLAMCYFWLFPGLKRHIQGQYFRSAEAFDNTVLAYVDSIVKEAWLEAFEMYKKRMKRYIHVQGDYFEKL